MNTWKCVPIYLDFKFTFTIPLHVYILNIKQNCFLDDSRENDDAIEEITSMPGVSRFGINQVIKHLEPLVQKGLKTVLLFGVIETLPKVKSNLSIWFCL